MIKSQRHKDDKFEGKKVCFYIMRKKLHVDFLCDKISTHIVA